MKNILYLLCLITSTQLYAIEYIQKFNKVPYNSNFDIEKELIKNNCTKIELQKNIFKNKNKINKKTKFVHLQTCYQKETFNDKDLSIIEWEHLKVKKGFILSLYIEGNKCKNIYTKQIPHFYLKNKKKPKDVNVFKIGKKIHVQKCYSDKVLDENMVIEPVDEESITIEEKAPIVIKEEPVYKFYASYKNEKYRNYYGLGYENKVFDSSLFFSQKAVNLEVNPSIITYKGVLSLETFLGYHSLDNISNFYGSAGIDMKLGKLTLRNIHDYKKQGHFIGLLYKINNPIQIETFYYQEELGAKLRIYLDF